MWEKLNAFRSLLAVAEGKKGEGGKEKGKRQTRMIQMLSKLHIPMSLGRNMKVALDLIQLQTSKNPTAIRRRTPKSRRPRPLGPPPPQRHNIMHMLLSKPLVMPLQILLPRDHLPVRIPSQLMNPLVVDPVLPNRRVAVQLGSGQDPVARRVLHVDVDVLALHFDDDVEVDVEGVGYALFDGEGVRFRAAPPARGFGPEEDEGDEGDEDGPFAAGGGAGYVLGF